MPANVEGSYATRFRRKYGGDEAVRREVAALYDLLADAIGAEKIVLRAGKLGALTLMRSADVGERLLALQRLVFEDPTLEAVPQRARFAETIGEIEDGLADLLAQRSVEDAIDRKVNAKMVDRHHEYVRELKLEAIRDNAGPETASTERRLTELVALDERRLGASALDVLRPKRLSDVVGQGRAVEALLAKLSSPFPQHVILYGPPGVGKTSAARLALEMAKTRPRAPFGNEAPFVEASGTTLRWDPRETTNPLLGSVHDPIYQGSRREFAENGIPEPKLGLVTRAHGGVLFIDEIGEMDPILQTKLLKVLEDKRVMFESSYYDENDPNVPAYVKRLFADGAPADFVLIGATTREPHEIDAAIRSRCAAVFFDPLSEHDVAQIVIDGAQRLNVPLAPAIPSLVASYTIEGRKAVQIVADAYGHALARTAASATPAIDVADVTAVVQAARIVPHTIVRARVEREIGTSFGMGVLHYLGSMIEIEAIAFPAKEARKGTIRFNDTAGSMAKDSVFNAAAALRRYASLDTADYDLHVNVIGGGQIDGPSAGLAIFAALYSAITETPIPQDVAITGELSIQGNVRPVGGLVEKLYAARQAGMRRALVPQENLREIAPAPEGIDVVAVRNVRDALAALDVTVPRATRRRVS